MAELEAELQSSPYFAGMSGKSGAEADALEHRIDELPQSLKELLLSEETDAKLRAAMQQAGVSDSYQVALAKVIFLAVLGDLPLSGFDELLGNIGLEEAPAHAMSLGLADILAPVAATRAKAASPPEMPRVPPLTVQRPQSGSPSGAPRNIIDLRKPPETP